MKTALVLGGGGFIGGHLAKRLKGEGFWVRVVDIKEQHEFWNHNDICDEYISGDLRDPKIVSQVMFAPNQHSEDDKVNSFDEVYQLAADMGWCWLYFYR
jgi:GDP-D-mannose 3',5'-epimerase